MCVIQNIDKSKLLVVSDDKAMAMTLAVSDWRTGDWSNLTLGSIVKSITWGWCPSYLACKQSIKMDLIFKRILQLSFEPERVIWWPMFLLTVSWNVSVCLTVCVRVCVCVCFQSIWAIKVIIIYLANLLWLQCRNVHTCTCLNDVAWG